MPPELIEQVPGWAKAVTDIGLVGWLALSIWALITGRVISRDTAEKERRDDAERLAYVEARRVEERDGRVKAEQRVTALTERWDRALQTLGSIERELIRVVGRGE